MQMEKTMMDPRYFQVIFQAIFLSYGLIYLGWNAEWIHYTASIGGCLLFNYLFECHKQRNWLRLTGRKGWSSWGFSVLISALSLCLLLKVDHWTVSLLAAFLTVASKYIFRFHQKHIFNPSAFGIISTIVVTHDAWLSPGQWGSGAIIFFSVFTLGTIVVTRVQKLDVSLAFLLVYIGLLYWRQVAVLGWPMDYWLHSISTGSLLLFSFFMISDPRTSPNHAFARIIWAVMIAAISFYLSAFKWKYNTPIWVLVAAGFSVPLFDYLFRSEKFSWVNSTLTLNIISPFKKIIMKPLMKKLAALVLILAMVSHEAIAFCGFYVSKADGTLKNKTSQVILVRAGNKNVITMYNDFQGDFKDFAMVVPVPVVLKKTDIKVVSPAIFSTLNEYSKPRLVEYWDANPCEGNATLEGKLAGLVPGVQTKSMNMKRESGNVKIEAQYLVGEYDILILSATESAALKTWLNENGYKIPPGADEVLEPYIRSNLKFFVVKVNEKELKKLNNNFLRPIQISFDSPKFMLPIRLGMANSAGDQDMLVYAFSRKGRIECTNYRTVSLPTGNNIPLFVQSNFGNFYANLFQHQWEKEGKSVAMLEYAWNVSPQNYVKCDPCVATAPSAQDLVQAGVWWINRDWQDYSDVTNNEDYDQNVFFTRLHIRYNRGAFPQDLMFQITPNTENFQARYVITHPATGNFNCDAGRQYLAELKQRRQKEMDMLSSLTGKSYQDWDLVLDEKNIPAYASYQSLSVQSRKYGDSKGVLFATIGVLGLVSLVGWGRRRYS